MLIFAYKNSHLTNLFKQLYGIFKHLIKVTEKLNRKISTNKLNSYTFVLLKMKTITIYIKSIIFIGALLIGQAGFAQTGFNKTNYYDVLNSGKLSAIEGQLKSVNTLSGNDKDAFEGALLMKKASKISVPAVKLSTFKKGHKKLESAISNVSSNIEYRFLRLIIQENAPKNLGYHKNISDDVKIIKEGKAGLNKITQTAIDDYSKHSKNL